MESKVEGESEHKSKCGSKKAKQDDDVEENHTTKFSATLCLPKEETQEEESVKPSQN